MDLNLRNKIGLENLVLGTEYLRFRNKEQLQYIRKLVSGRL